MAIRPHACPGICLEFYYTGAILDVFRYFCLRSWMVSSYCIFNYWTLATQLAEILLPISSVVSSIHFTYSCWEGFGAE